MIPVSTTELPVLKFDFKAGENSKRFRMSSNKIGWFHAVSEKPGAKFDLTIKDAIGRPIFRRDNMGGTSERSGELLNLETRLGEEVEVVIENVRGAEKLDVFLN